jgi:hypothetical protein
VCLQPRVLLGDDDRVIWGLPVCKSFNFPDPQCPNLETEIQSPMLCGYYGHSMELVRDFF